MVRPVQVLVAATVLFMVTCTGCTSPKVPPPVDPIKDKISILQKQLLELQNAQNETRKKVDEQAATINNLSIRIKSAEERNAALSSSAPVNQKQAGNSQVASTKKTVKSKSKKKKPVRRQEQ